ncbi:MAG: hypothetical protein H6724_04775 [Sandaracinus sp.]|nr:hypothetical protein [Sandaracinus sp.]MCB9618751.1 hypothetical protein [Sandaracinus sp.]
MQPALRPDRPSFVLALEERGTLRRYRLEARLREGAVVVATGLLAGAAQGHCDITDYAFRIRARVFGGALWIEVQRADGVRERTAPAFVRVSVACSTDHGRTWTRTPAPFPEDGIELARFAEGDVFGFDEA